MRERVFFTVDADQIVGDLHWPAGPGPHPAAVVAGPMTSVKEQVTGVYASALAVRGIAALAIDHRHFGESGGEPRQYEHPARKVDDLVSAFEWLGSRAGVDPGRRSFVGICLGASYAAAAAARLGAAARALATVVGYFPDPHEMDAGSPGFAAEIDSGRRARLRYESTGVVDTVPAASTAGDGAPMTKPDVVEYYSTSRAGVPNYANSFAVMSREPWLGFDAHAAALELTVPSLFVHAEAGLAPHWAERFAAAVPAATAWHWLDGPGQTAFYDDPALVNAATDLAAAHLAAHV
jgi:fermentation-respiration switch protein FrsA (DUF1100 family)